MHMQEKEFMILKIEKHIKFLKMNQLIFTMEMFMRMLKINIMYNGKLVLEKMKI